MKTRHAAVGTALLLLVASCGESDVSDGGRETPTTAASVEEATSTTEIPVANTSTTTSTPPTSSTTSSTTTVPPVPDPAAIEFINAWATALNAGDHGAAADMVVAARQWDAPGDSDEERERNTRLFFEVWVLLDSQFSVDECLARSSGITECRITRQVELSPHAPDPETSLLRVRFDDDGSLAYASTVPKQADPWFGPYLAFKQWTLDTYGTGSDSPYTALFGAVDIAGYEQILAEQLDIWVAEHG